MSNIADLASQAGFTKAASEAEAARDFKRRMVLAYEHYRYVTPKHIADFNERLKAQTLKRTGRTGLDLREHYDMLKFTSAMEYKTMPPADVLEKVKEARSKGIFDTFEVAQIESQVDYKDPIVFGRINGCGDKFFVAQWDSDVKIEDILKEGEG